MELDRVSREEIVALCCRQTHQLKPKSIYVNEDDVLYSIFGIRVGQTPSFMCTWLKLYADMYWRQFKRVTANYLKSKVLEFDHWRESIKDGRKGDVMALLGLNYLMGTHTMIHLSGKRIWSTHWGNLPHDYIVYKCEFHLLYLGRGIYAELVKRDHPLVEVNDLEGSKSLVVGTLSMVEDGVVTKLVHLGLGFSVDRTAKTKDGKDDQVSMDDAVPEGKPSTSSHGEIPPSLILKHCHL